MVASCFSRARALVPCLLLFLAACAPLIAGYSLEAYRNATSLKAETLALMAEAGEPYAQHEDEVKALKVKLSAAQEFVAGMANNSLSAEQWTIMNDPDGGLAGEYWAVWEAQQTVSAPAMGAQIQQVGAAFDEIICLEANKEKDTAC